MEVDDTEIRQESTEIQEDEDSDDVCKVHHITRVRFIHQHIGS